MDLRAVVPHPTGTFCQHKGRGAEPDLGGDGGEGEAGEWQVLYACGEAQQWQWVCSRCGAREEAVGVDRGTAGRARLLTATW